MPSVTACSSLSTSSKGFHSKDVILDTPLFKISSASFPIFLTSVILATVSWETEKAENNKKDTDKSGDFSDKLVDRIDFIFACFDNIFAIFFIFRVIFAISFDNVFDDLDNMIGLVDGFLEAGILGFDFDGYFYVIFRLFDLILDVKDDSCSFLLLFHLCLCGEYSCDSEE